MRVLSGPGRRLVSTNAIGASGLRKRFGTTQALDGVDLVSVEGTVLGVLGPNGAGKTTAVRVLATGLKPDAGSARVAGHDVVREPHRVRASIGLTETLLTGGSRTHAIRSELAAPARSSFRGARTCASRKEPKVSLVGLPLLLLVGAATVVAPVVTGLVWRRARTRRLGVVGRVAAVLGCQVLAVAITFLAVNRDFVFYASWSDLLGTSAPTPAIQTQNLVRAGQGSVEVVQVHGAASGVDAPVLVWRPPQYDQPAFAHTKFPVVMVLPGQPSSPAVMFAHFNFGAEATQAIESHLVKPFVAVFPPLMTDPPRDTECTDVPGGPKAETWLAKDVRDALLQHDRVASTPSSWAVAGYSTGAFCAVKLLLAHPGLFTDAAGFGGYYQPLTDHTTGNLFGSSRIRYDENSPLWLYGRTGLVSGHRMLLITSREDTDSYAETEKMLAATRGDPGVSSLVFSTGGHNYRNYADATPAVLRWLGQGQPDFAP